MIVCYKSIVIVSIVRFFASLFLHQMIFLLLMIKYVPIVNIFIPNVLYFVLQTIDEVASVKIMKGKVIIEVIIIRQENEDKFWFI